MKKNGICKIFRKKRKSKSAWDCKMTKQEKKKRHVRGGVREKKTEKGKNQLYSYLACIIIHDLVKYVIIHYYMTSSVSGQDEPNLAL